MARGSPGETVDRRLRSDPFGRRIETIEYIDAATGAVMDGVGSNPSPRRTRHVYFGLEVIQEYACGADAGTPSNCHTAHGGPGCNDAACEAAVCAVDPPCCDVWDQLCADQAQALCASCTDFTLAREFVHGDPERYPEVVAMIDHYGTGRTENVPTGGFVYHYLHDVLGSVIGLTDETGLPRERYTYDPYGKGFIEKWDENANGGDGAFVESAEPNSGMPYSSVGNPFMWTGHRYDEAVGLYHMLFRFYDPALGRWLQRDPIEYADGVNLYEYTVSSPLFWIDPLGLEIIWVKRPGCSDADLKKAQDQLEEAKKRRNPDGTKGEGVRNIEDLEKDKDRKVIIEVGPLPPNKSNSARVHDPVRAGDPSIKDAKGKTGSDTTITFDPDKKGKFSDGIERDPESSLLHELTHAKQNADGKRATTEEVREVTTTGVENEHCRNKGLPQRRRYGNWPVPQHPVPPHSTTQPSP